LNKNRSNKSTTLNPDGSPHNVFRICITGGPCAGKTSCLNILKERFSSNFIVYRLPELATILFEGGVTLLPSAYSEEEHAIFIEELVRTQMCIEDHFDKIAQLQKKDVVLLIDRGVLDNFAYCTPDVKKVVLERNNWDEEQLRDTRYNAVVHLVTAADGADKFYSLTNNSARSEGLDEARALDKATRGVWRGHRNHIIIGNTFESFEAKITSAYIQLCETLHFTPIPTFNRKYLLKGNPNLDSSEFDSFCEFTDTYTFMRNKSKDHLIWVLKRSFKDSSALNMLIYVDRTLASTNSERIEVTSEISYKLYEEYLKLRDPQRNDVVKNVIWAQKQSRVFEIENYSALGNSNCWVLRTFYQNELPNDDLEAVTWVDIQRDITDDEQYFTYSLSKN